MVRTVNAAFSIFNKNEVNLETERTKTARSSRDWLINQLLKLPEKIEGFPDLFDGMHIKFGSFARNTKIKPLDDIDLILTLHACGSTYDTFSPGKSYSLKASDTATKLLKLCNSNGTINSIKVINKLVSSLKDIDQYSSADIHRQKEAATLKLKSYEWNFDIVPAFYADRGFYQIPDGYGGWKATDPRIDQNRVTTINQKHNGKVNQILRTLKFWNNHVQMPTITSYLLENLALNFFGSKEKINDYVDVNMINFWFYLKTAIYEVVPDPKGFQDNLNDLSNDDRDKISEKANDSYERGYEAYKIETEENNQEKAINKWRAIFGDSFPKFE